jgi:RNA polymerase sigma-70 factor (ECF subfamily)
VSDPRGASAPAPLLEPGLGALEVRDEIAAAVARGDLRHALGLCVRQHAASVGRLCMAMLGSQTDADDLAQETFFTAHGALGEFRGESSMRAWLLGIARNKCLQHLEKTRRRGAHLRLVPNPETTADAEEVMSVQQRAERTRALLARVRPSDRDALLLRYAAELSFKEVAEVCGIPEPTARKRVSRALSRLRTELGKEEGDD